MADDTLDLRRMREIVRQIDEAILAHVTRTGWSTELRRAYDTYWADLQELWRIVVVEARESGTPAQEIRHAKRIGYSFEQIRMMVQARATGRRADDQTTGRRVRRKNREAGVRRGGDIRDETSKLDRRIADEARTLRAKHSYSREHSTRWLSGEIAKRVRRPVPTIRGRVKALGLK